MSYWRGISRNLGIVAIIVWLLTSQTYAEFLRKPIFGVPCVDDTIYVVAEICSKFSFTIAEILDRAIVAINPDLASSPPMSSTNFGQMIENLHQQDEIEKYGYRKGPIRKFMDRYCIIGILVGSDQCSN